MNPQPITSESPRDLRRWVALIVVCLGQLMIVLDTTIVNVALPSIQRDLHLDGASLTWVVSAYLVSFGSFLLLAGRIGDLVGRKKVFLSGVVLFVATSALCGLAWNSTALIVARFLQGLGGALASAVIVALIVTGFPDPAERPRAMSVFTFVIAGGASLGLVTGGLLTQAINWHWIFFINLPIGVLTLVLGWVLIEENHGIGVRQGVDVLGSILITSAMMLGVYAIVQSADHGWWSAPTAGLGGAAALLLAAFLALEARLRNPIMPLRIFRLRSLAGSSAARAMLAPGMFSSFFFGTQYLQHILSYGAVGTGLAFLPQTFAVGVLSVGPTAALMRRIGARPTLYLGLAAMVAGLAVLAYAAAQGATYFPTFFLSFALLGLGAGTAFVPLIAIAMSDVPPQDAGLASAITNVSLQMSAAIGLAALGTVSANQARTLAAHGSPLREALAGGYQLALVVATVCVAASALIAIVALRPARPAGGRGAPAGPDLDEEDVQAPAA
jgi:EmrB/QacA subfamily drug resistance transporter